MSNAGLRAALYALRERQRLWSWSAPSRWLVLSSVADLLIASTSCRRSTPAARTGLPGCRARRARVTDLA